MHSDTLLIERYESVAVLMLNRPDKLNAIDQELHSKVMASIEELGHDDEVRAVVVTGAGHAFCAGPDLSSWLDDDEPISQNDRLDRLMWWGRQTLALACIDKPTIAAVNGVAAGLGMSIALHCDLRVGGAHTRFRTAFVERCLSPDSGLSWLLPRVIGYSRAADLIMTSRTVDAEEAYRLGLLDRVVSDDTPLEAAVELARQITQWPPTSLRTAKRVLQHTLTADLPDQIFHENIGLGQARSAPNDVREARAAFLERRPGQYTGT